MSIIYLIRHGAIPQSDPRRSVGGHELLLADKSKEQLLEVRFRLGRKSGHHVYRSIAVDNRFELSGQDMSDEEGKMECIIS
jgi:hypothetical protein